MGGWVRQRGGLTPLSFVPVRPEGAWGVESEACLPQLREVGGGMGRRRRSVPVRLPR